MSRSSEDNRDGARQPPQTMRRSVELDALLTAARRAVLEAGDFQSAARSIFDSCKQVIGAAAGYVALLSPRGDENEVVFLDAGGRPCSVDPALPMPVRGLRELAYRTNEAVYDNDFANSRWMRYMPQGHVGLDNVLFAPLVVGGRTVGLIGLANKPGGFTDEDAATATVFGELAAIALVGRRMVSSLQHSEERFRAVVETATDAVISVDAKGKVVFWNRAAETVFGYTADEMAGRGLDAIIPERHQDAHRHALQHIGDPAKSSLIGRTVELTGVRKGGEEFPIELSLAAWQTAEGRFFTGIIRDISQRK
jgi:PAS domain S-box-containing protein